MNLEESQSSTENTIPTLSNPIGWVTFDETDNKDSICNNCMSEEKVSEEKGRYVSRLGEFKVLRKAQTLQDVFKLNMGEEKTNGD